MFKSYQPVIKASLVALSFALSGISFNANAYTSVIDQNSDSALVPMASFNQGGLVQSFEQSAPNISGAGIFVGWIDGSSTVGGNIYISLWDSLPDQPGANKLTSGFSSVDDNYIGWIDVFWDPISTLANTTYYLAFETDTSNTAINGDIFNPYPKGATYANSYSLYPDYDYTFRTYTAITTVPEPESYAMLFVGMALITASIKYRSNKKT